MSTKNATGVGHSPKGYLNFPRPNIDIKAPNLSHLYNLYGLTADTALRKDFNDMDFKKCLKTMLRSEAISPETAELLATMAQLIETQRTMIDKLLEDNTNWQVRSELINQSLQEVLTAQSRESTSSQSKPLVSLSFPPLSDN